MLVNTGENGWTAAWFVGLRALVGLYVAAHYAALLPWATEVFSSAGMMPRAEASPLFGVLPSVLMLSDAPVVVVSLVVLGVVSGVGLASGRGARGWALLGWYVGACLLGRNPLILSPALPHVGWLLLWLTAFRHPTSAEDDRWRLPPAFFAAGWWLMGIGLAWSAVTKLGSVSWIDGSALHHVWDNPLARDTPLRPWLAALPDVVVKVLTWGTLVLELVALAAAVVPRLRPVVWLLLLGMHLGLLVTVDFADLTLGMLVVHAALFDPRWVGSYSWARSCGRTVAPRGDVFV